MRISWEKELIKLVDKSNSKQSELNIFPQPGRLNLLCIEWWAQHIWMHDLEKSDNSESEWRERRNQLCWDRRRSDSTQGWPGLGSMWRCSRSGPGSHAGLGAGPCLTTPYTPSSSPSPWTHWHWSQSPGLESILSSYSDLLSHQPLITNFG